MYKTYVSMRKLFIKAQSYETKERSTFLIGTLMYCYCVCVKWKSPIVSAYKEMKISHFKKLKKKSRENESDKMATQTFGLQHREIVYLGWTVEKEMHFCAQSPQLPPVYSTWGLASVLGKAESVSESKNTILTLLGLPCLKM